MEPGQLLVGLLYVWLLASLAVYAWRGYRKVVHHETRQDRAARRAGAAPADTVPAPVEAPPEGSLVREAIRAELEERAAAGGADPPPPGRSGVFARPAGGPDAPPPRAPVAELVAGIALPCDLVPLVTGDELDPHRAVFATTAHDATEVGAALADELERLGFSLRTVGDTEAVATRAGAELRVRIHDPGPHADRDGRPLFPTAPRGGVVVELTT
jgi:hypothetical protein